MNRPFITIAAGMTLVATALAQPPAGGRGGRGGATGFQQFGGIGITAERQVNILPLNGPAVTGSPLSATEERRTVQTLGDGTVLETSDTNLLYRDSQGRTRTDRTIQGKTTILISDPVAHIRVGLDPSSKTARKSMMPAGTPGAEAVERLRSELETRVRTNFLSRGAAADGDTTQEDLGTLSQNGVPAQGTRTTLIIPAGKIGNNRDIRVVNERWYSNELQMLVKSVNSDPRFGTTTYQLTNIVRVNPDAGLFQIPGDYTVLEGGGRGAPGR